MKKISNIDSEWSSSLRFIKSALDNNDDFSFRIFPNELKLIFKLAKSVQTNIW